MSLTVSQCLLRLLTFPCITKWTFSACNTCMWGALAPLMDSTLCHCSCLSLIVFLFGICSQKGPQLTHLLHSLRNLFSSNCIAFLLALNCLFLWTIFGSIVVCGLPFCLCTLDASSLCLVSSHLFAWVGSQCPISVPKCWQQPQEPLCLWILLFWNNACALALIESLCCQLPCFAATRMVVDFFSNSSIPHSSNTSIRAVCDSLFVTLSLNFPFCQACMYFCSSSLH